MSGLGAEAYRVQTGAELGHLLTWLGPEDTLQGMFFRSLQDAMLTLLGEAAMEACLEEVSGERDFVDFFAYPAVDFLRMVRRAAWLMEERGVRGRRRCGCWGTWARRRS
ncbi:TIGR02265 family protein [Cystobacter fuscus]